MSNELTPAEVVATKLLGWRVLASHHDMEGHRYVHSSGYRLYLPDNSKRGDGGITGHWPDFTDERQAWYWIRRVEDALRALDKDLFDDYMMYVTRKCDYDRRDAWLATVPQRLEAAIRVIEEAGL